MFHTWMAELDGKMKWVPQVPGYVSSPNSPPASLTPNHLNLPGATLDVVGEGPEVVEVDKVVLAVVVVVVAAVPGKHWLYQAFEYVQVYPATQVVSPPQPEPPHCWYAPAAAKAPVTMVLAAIKVFIVG